MIYRPERNRKLKKGIFPEKQKPAVPQEAIEIIATGRQNKEIHEPGQNTAIEKSRKPGLGETGKLPLPVQVKINNKGNRIEKNKKIAASSSQGQPRLQSDEAGQEKGNGSLQAAFLASSSLRPIWPVRM